MVKNKKNCIKFLFVGLFLIFIENNFCAENAQKNPKNAIEISDDFAKQLLEVYQKNSEEERKFKISIVDFIKKEFLYWRGQELQREANSRNVNLIIQCVQEIKNNVRSSCIDFYAHNALLPKEQQDKNIEALNSVLDKMNTLEEKLRELKNAKNNHPIGNTGQHDNNTNP
jgi:hypothetical protein